MEKLLVGFERLCVSLPLNPFAFNKDVLPGEVGPGGMAHQQPSPVL